MTALYDRFAASALRLLTAYGKQVTLFTQVGGAQFVMAVEEAYEDKSIDGRLVEAGDIKLHMAVSDIDGEPVYKPEADVDTVTFSDGVTWTIKRVQPVSPGDQAVLYTLQLRR